ncbi:MAG: cell division protein SepF [Lachnospiraceae bacterium]|nr:cell division protein SepF [Lachnospiraceae bacterium]
MGIKNFLELFQFREDEFDDEQFDEDDRTLSLNLDSTKQSYDDEEDEFSSYLDKKYNSDSRKVRAVKVDRASSKIVPIKAANKSLEVSIMKPGTFADSQDICDMLLEGRAVVVNLEGFDPLEAQRIMDFISGCVYSINGRLHQISRYIFIFSPDSIDISGDYLDIATDDDGFGVPTINQEF